MLPVNLVLHLQNVVDSGRNNSRVLRYFKLGALEVSFHLLSR